MFKANSKNDAEFMLESLKSGLRLDGRGPLEYREMSFAFGKADGQVMVQIGRTVIYITLSTVVVDPFVERAREGIYRINIDVSSIQADSDFNTRVNDMKIEVGRLIERVLLSSHAVDKDSLCIVHGKIVWMISVNIEVLSYDGDLIDPICASVLLALRNIRLPHVEINGDKVVVSKLGEKRPFDISVHHLPLCVTFYFYNKSSTVLLDPNEKEEKMAEGRLTIAMNIFKDVCGIHSSGHLLFLPDTIFKSPLLEKYKEAAGKMTKVEKAPAAAEKEVGDDEVLEMLAKNK